MNEEGVVLNLKLEVNNSFDDKLIAKSKASIFGDIASICILRRSFLDP